MFFAVKKPDFLAAKNISLCMALNVSCLHKLYWVLGNARSAYGGRTDHVCVDVHEVMLHQHIHLVTVGDHLLQQNQVSGGIAKRETDDLQTFI